MAPGAHCTQCKAWQGSPLHWFFCLGSTSRLCLLGRWAVGHCLHSADSQTPPGARRPQGLQVPQSRFECFIARSPGYCFLCKRVISFLQCSMEQEEGVQARQTTQRLQQCWCTIAF